MWNRYTRVQYLLNSFFMSQTITCPSCKTQIDLGKISEEKYRLELEAEFEKERASMRKKAQEYAEQKMAEQAKKDSVELEDMKKRLEEQSKKEDEFRKQELEMRKKQRELEEAAKNGELEMQRKLDVEKKKLEEQMAKTQATALDSKIKEIQEEGRKKEQEMLKQQEQMKKTIDDLKRKSEQGSQQIQGDIQEEDIKLALDRAFPVDSIEDVPTGVKGADLIQYVNNNFGQKAWTIVWESKNTKSWQDAWVMKLKEDSLKISGNISVLVTTVLPKWVVHFGMLDGVMVCLPEYSIAVASILRERLLAIAKVETSMQWKDAKMEMLYSYLSSEEFSSKMHMMVDVFSNLKSGIDKERRAMETNWKRREKDIERATFAVTGMYWELESLMGQSLPGSGDMLSLEEWEEEETI